MSEITKYLKRAIDERPKGGMQTGVPKVTMREADAARLLAEIEELQRERDELKQRHGIVNRMQRDMSIDYDELQYYLLEYHNIIDLPFLDGVEQLKKLAEENPRERFSKFTAEVLKRGFVQGFFAASCQDSDGVIDGDEVICRAGVEYEKWSQTPDAEEILSGCEAGDE